MTHTLVASATRERVSKLLERALVALADVFVEGVKKVFEFSCDRCLTQWQSPVLRDRFVGVAKCELHVFQSDRRPWPDFNR